GRHRREDRAAHDRAGEERVDDAPDARAVRAHPRANDEDAFRKRRARGRHGLHSPKSCRYMLATFSSARNEAATALDAARPARRARAGHGGAPAAPQARARSATGRRTTPMAWKGLGSPPS